MGRGAARGARGGVMRLTSTARLLWLLALCAIELELDIKR